MARFRGCRRCSQAFTPEPGSADPLCPACREQVATWNSDERLTALAQQGFEEAMGMRLPAPQQFPGLPADAGLRAHHVQPSAGMAPQQVTRWPDGGTSAVETMPDYTIVPGQVRCRHCAVSLTAAADGTWTDIQGFATCFSEDVLHEPLPAGLDGSPA